MTNQAQLVDFLRQLPSVRALMPVPMPPAQSGLAWDGVGPLWQPPPPTSEDLGHAVFAAAGQAGIRLGGFFGTTPGHVLASAAADVIAPQYQVPFNLLVEALTIAARRQQEAGEAAARPWIVGAAAVAALMSYSFLRRFS